jgi:hypothetical protein
VAGRIADVRGRGLKGEETGFEILRVGWHPIRAGLLCGWAEYFSFGWTAKAYQGL